MQLRYLQTLNSISAENNSTIVFPVPIDIMSEIVEKKVNAIIIKLLCHFVSGSRFYTLHLFAGCLAEFIRDVDEVLHIYIKDKIFILFMKRVTTKTTPLFISQIP